VEAAVKAPATSAAITVTAVTEASVAGSNEKRNLFFFYFLLFFELHLVF
jgi:hypothetical protein